MALLTQNITTASQEQEVGSSWNVQPSESGLALSHGKGAISTRVGCIRKPPLLTSVSKVISPHWIPWNSFSVASFQILFPTLLSSLHFAVKILTKFLCHWNLSRKLAKMKHVYFPLIFFSSKESSVSEKKLGGGHFAHHPVLAHTHTHCLHIHIKLHVLCGDPRSPCEMFSLWISVGWKGKFCPETVQTPHNFRLLA